LSYVGQLAGSKNQYIHAVADMQDSLRKMEEKARMEGVLGGKSDRFMSGQARCHINKDIEIGEGFAGGLCIGWPYGRNNGVREMADWVGRCGYGENAEILTV
ncbi:MAG: hypothetical protein HQM00_00975, partial [Magnetococcales bacterium]|nr:hypothetical protein [Magnetococcales bacterium]